jgi:hypothetical protein
MSIIHNIGIGATKGNRKIQIVVENNITGERYPVGEFYKVGDALIALKAFKKSETKNLKYFIYEKGKKKK